MVRFPYQAGRDSVYLPKPAYHAAKALTEFLSGFTFVRRLAASRPRDFVLLFARGEELRLAAWTAARGPATVVIPAASGAFRVLSHKGEPGAPIAAGPEGLRIELDGSPRYLTPEKPDTDLRAAPAWQPGLIPEYPPGTLEPVAGFDRLPAGWNLVPDGDEKVAFTATLTARAPAEGIPLPGMEVLRIDYAFGDGWRFARIAPATDLPIAGKPEEFGLWIHGDGTGNLARLRFTDSSGQTFQPDGFAIDWKGWRYVVFPMDGTESGHWGGADDGVVHYPVRWDSLFLIDSARQRATKGAVSIAGPVLVLPR